MIFENCLMEFFQLSMGITTKHKSNHLLETTTDTILIKKPVFIQYLY